LALTKTWDYYSYTGLKASRLGRVLTAKNEANLVTKTKKYSK